MAARLGDGDRQFYLDRALMAADWFVRTQLGQWRPLSHLGDDRLVYDEHYFGADYFEGQRDPSKDWTTDRGIAFDANRGRFMYYYYMPDGRFVPGLNWTMGRALFVLTEAYKITGQARYLESAVFGGRYVEGLTVTDPHYDQCLGAIRELTAQGNGGGSLDAAQAASALVMLERVTGDANWLRLARMFGEFVLRHWSPTEGLPTVALLWPAQRVLRQWSASCIQHCITMPLWHLYRRTGEDRFLPPVLWAAERVLGHQRPDGALLTSLEIDPEKPPTPNHHHGIGAGEDRWALRNDDGVVVLILAAHMATGERKYLDAAVAYADWIVSRAPAERPYCVFPVQANNVLDIGRAAGKDYSAWVRDNLKARLLDLQVTDSDDPKALGGFRGEDEQGDGGVFGGTSLDYVVTRTTCYSAGTLLRLSGRGTGAGFSPWGLGD